METQLNEIIERCKERDKDKVELRISPTVVLLVDKHKATEEYRQKRAKEYLKIRIDESVQVS